MLINLFLKSFFIGATIAVPVGPIGLLCLRRLLIQGPIIGIISGLGGATADIIFSSLALLSISAITPIFAEHMILVRLLSSLFLVAVGIHLVISPQPKSQKSWTHNKLQAYLSTLFLTLTNPLLILSFAAFFNLFHIGTTSVTIGNMTLIWLGIFCGSSWWWFLLGGIRFFFKFDIQPHFIKLINRLSGYVVIAIALLTLIMTLF